MAVTYFEISYPNFVLGAIIDPVEANQNNNDIVNKINEFVDVINANEVEVGLKAYKTYVDTQDAGLAGVGRTTQTIKGNFDNLVTHKTSSDHDSRYYTKTELNAGQLDSRYYTETELNNGQLDNRYYTETELNNGQLDNRYYTETELNNGQLNTLYYTKTDLIPYLTGGDTLIHEEVFTIVSADNLDGTFTYTSNGIDNIVGTLGGSGEQIFELVEGNYTPGFNRVEAIVNDTLRRSVVSGGLIEVDGTHIGLTSPEGVGAEITIRYYERIGAAGEYNIRLTATQPPQLDGRTIWFQITG